MPAYDFTGLSPADFESLCHDLLEPALGVPLQEFVTGRDKGIDLRHAPVAGRDWIVQCKHFARSGYAKLRSHLKANELPKINKLQPSRYILATSVGLSPPNVDELFDLLSPYCRSKHDIYGRTDLNALLRKQPSVEQAHFKLWLTSEPVLSRVLHNDVFVQSSMTEGDIRQRLSLYVYTATFDSARTKLNEDRVCILSGIPGVGKTTLAEMLLVEYLMNDWELISIQQNVSEGQRLFRSDPKAKQVFYYDDFLGQVTKGDKLGKNEDRVLLQLIQAVARNRNKRFILTTREYILAQAKAEHEYLARSKIDLYRFVVKCEDYGDMDKARILANHLYFAQVPQEHIAALVDNRSYRDIISHRNYNPRIIEWMTHIAETSACKPKKYPKVFLERLDNPTELWTHAFENQISEASRHLLLVLGTCGDGIFLTDLQKAFDPFFVSRAQRYGFPASPSSFIQALDELEGNFIRIERSESQLVVRLHNPSIMDFLKDRFLRNPVDIAELLTCAPFFEQVERLVATIDSDSSGRGGSRPQTGIDPHVVAEAIDRTLLARSIRLRHYERPQRQWSRIRESVWERLRACCRIGTQICDVGLHQDIQEHIDAQLASAASMRGDVSEIGSLLDVIEMCEWSDKDRVARWIAKTWEEVLAMQDEFEESLDGLVTTAQWFVGNRWRFDDEQAKRFVENVKTAVTREIEEQSDRTDPERLGGDLALVEEIGKTLSQDFSQEVRWLNEAMSGCGPRGGDDDMSGWRDHRTKADSSSIESMFEALLE